MTYELPPEAQKICEQQCWNDHNLSQILLKIMGNSFTKKNLDQKIIEAFKEQQREESPESYLGEHHILALIADMIGMAEGIQTESGMIESFTYASIAEGGEHFTGIEIHCLSRTWKISVEEVK